MRKFFLSIMSFISMCGCFAQEASQEEVLAYWFGDSKKMQEVSLDRSKLWFTGGPSVDKEISECFGYLVQKAMYHKLDAWKQTPQGRLALILLVDQFSRNIYRGRPESFAADLFAQELALEGMILKEDLGLSPLERVFFYLPLEHAENLELQELSVKAFQKLLDSVSMSEHSLFESFLDYALRHHVIIEKFGRFPHRNSILGRESTLEELEFLKGPRSSF